MPSSSSRYHAVMEWGRRGVKERLRKHLRENSAMMDAWVRMIWDRRLGERRRQREPVTVERRRAERRRTAPAPWASLGFLVVPWNEAPAPHGAVLGPGTNQAGASVVLRDSPFCVWSGSTRLTG